MKKLIVFVIIFGAFLAASDSHGLGGWARNSTATELWHIDSTSIKIGHPPFFSFSFSKITCCVDGTEMSACNREAENPKCEKTVVRGAYAPLKVAS
ncbi:hypothetical protein [Algoriphagus chordae]|uniref:Uncharacterized protein n=1 Tax=Algoriphagus chordae TaxID=237019 RepID=A0A2W7S0R1_9BACT|nr:hypothetical protein [Algoriphagus chordae]PZX56675.1 hypothetical protein LV85_00606 [Algoriphagus chordae]